MTTIAIRALPEPTSRAKTLRKFKSEFTTYVSPLRLLEVDWPPAVGVVEFYADFLTDSVRVNGHPVLFVALKRALDVYESYIGRRDDLRFARFVCTFIAEISAVLTSHRIEDGDGGVWDPSGREPLRSWLKGRTAYLRKGGLPIADMDSLLLRKALPERQRQIVETAEAAA